MRSLKLFMLIVAAFLVVSSQAAGLEAHLQDVAQPQQDAIELPPARPVPVLAAEVQVKPPVVPKIGLHRPCKVDADCQSGKCQPQVVRGQPMRLCKDKLF